MKFCTKCGNKLEENAKYCTACGNPTIEQLEKIQNIKKKRNDEKKENLILYLGFSLIIIASIIFAFSNWEDMSYVFRILFLVVEMIIFLTLSIFSKGFKNHLPYKTLWFVGLLFLPLIIVLIANYEVFGTYLSYKGAGIFVYLSISWILCFVLQLFSYKLLDSKMFLYLSFVYLYAALVNLLSIFGLQTKEIHLIFVILSIINLIIVFLNNINKNEILKEAINRFMSLLLVVFAAALSIINSKEIMACFIHTPSVLLSKVLLIICSLTTIISLFVLMRKNSRKMISYTYPLFILAIISNIVLYIGNNINIWAFITILSSILIYFLISLFNNKVYRVTSFILMILTIYSTIIFETLGYKLILIITIISIIVKLFISKLRKNEVEEVINSLLYPIDVILVVLSVFEILNKHDFIPILIISTILYFTIHIILDTKSKNKLDIQIFEIFTYIFLVISSIAILSYGTILYFVLNEICYLYCFIYRFIKKKNKAINTTLYVLIFVNLLTCSIKFNMQIYYILLFVAFVNIITYIVSFKIEKKQIKSYFYTSLIISSLVSLFAEFNEYALISICVNVLIYSIIYYVNVKNVRANIVIKYIYTIIGFILIYKLFSYFIDESVIVNALTLVSYIIIIISMFLLQVDSDRIVLSYSPIILLPYLSLVDEVKIFESIQTELIVFIMVTLILIYTEKVIKMKRLEDKTILQLILLGFVSLVSIFDMLIFNFILSVFYIFYGLYTKRDSFVVFGVVLTLVSILIKLLEIADNLLSTYMLLLLGAVLVIYVFCKESKRNKKK